MFKTQTKRFGYNTCSGIYASVNITKRVIRGVTDVPGKENINDKDVK